MNTKEIIISFSVLLAIIVLFMLLLRSGSRNIKSSGGLPETVGDESIGQPEEGLSMKQEESGFDDIKKEEPARSNIPASQNPPVKKSPPEIQLEENMDYQAVVRTSMGEIKLDLFETDAPMTVSNFVYLSKGGFYNGLIFHRVIDDFMIQGGDPTGTGSGGPGYNFKDEINTHKLVKGSLAMANAGANTNGSQFFIVTKSSTPWLDGKHTNFGVVLEGMDVVEKMAKVKTDSNSRPLEEIVINSVEILEISRKSN